MQPTSELYQELLNKPHRKEVRLAIGENGRLITKLGNAITFGGTRILTGVSGADGGYTGQQLISVTTTGAVFSQDTPMVGCCVSGEITVRMLKPAGEIPRQARIVPYVRLTDGVNYSEWLQKGVYYIDTRQVEDRGSPPEYMTIHGYDDMLRTEQDYPSSKLQWPARDIDVVREIADFIGVPIDARTVALMSEGYLVSYPSDYSCREVLGYIAAMYAGCFVMSDLGELRLITLYDLPKETSYLVTGNGQPITFGGVRIRV